MNRTALTVFAVLVGTAPTLFAQDWAEREAELNSSAAKVLLQYASKAKRSKVGPQARLAYKSVIDNYDTGNSPARRALGFKKVKGTWLEPPPSKRKEWVDNADDEKRFSLKDDWYKTAMKLAALHRDLGLEMVKADELVRGTHHLTRSVFYNPYEKDAHLALGHKEWEGFFGTDEQITFVKSMKRIERKALELAKKEYDVKPVPEADFPEVLGKSGFEFSGSQSSNFVVFTRGTQENADDCVMWCERALDFLEFTVGEDRAKKLQLRRRVPRHYAYRVFVWTPTEREEFLKNNPEIWSDVEGGYERVTQFANYSWRTEWKGRKGGAELNMKLTPAQMHDRLISHVWEIGTLQTNSGLQEGAIHAATWFLMSTCISQRGAPPEGTVTDGEVRLPEGANWWMRAIRDQATAGTDWPLNQVPRERMSKFRNDCRLKTWSFSVWAMAAHPEKWFDFLRACPSEKIPFPEEIDKIGAEVFEQPLKEVEDAWREWARGSSGVAEATGYGPPLLPPRPNKAEVVGLTRLNAVRGLLDLASCELDAEASLACREHAKYLTMHPEHHKWPEAHEQNPAREGFTPRGMRAGMRSVIAWTTGNGSDFAESSIDGWIGTVYHRFPLLEHNIRRFGYALEEDNGFTFTVLDMGSLEEPYDPAKAPEAIMWPPSGMKNVPRKFHGIEHPNPIGDYNSDPESIARTGYPVSLQLSRLLAQSIATASITVSTKGKNVSTWDHTPDTPLLKRMEDKEVVFAIPKEPLEPNTKYDVVVLLRGSNGAEKKFEWSFTTGRQMEGLGRLR